MSARSLLFSANNKQTNYYQAEPKQVFQLSSADEFRSLNVKLGSAHCLAEYPSQRLDIQLGAVKCAQAPETSASDKLQSFERQTRLWLKLIQSRAV